MFSYPSIHSDAVVSQVLDELGLTLTDELSSEYLCIVNIGVEGTVWQRQEATTHIDLADQCSSTCW